MTCLVRRHSWYESSTLSGKPATKFLVGGQESSQQRRFPSLMFVVDGMLASLMHGFIYFRAPYIAKVNGPPKNPTTNCYDEPHW